MSAGNTRTCAVLTGSPTVRHHGGLSIRRGNGTGWHARGSHGKQTVVAKAARKPGHTSSEKEPIVEHAPGVSKAWSPNPGSCTAAHDSSRSPFQQHLFGSACILLVALLWGSYAPALRYAYQLPGGPSPLVLTVLRGLIQCSILLAANQMWPSDGNLAAEAAAAAAPPDQASAEPSGDGGVDHSPQQQDWQRRGPAGIAWLGTALASVSPTVLGGLEIGAYNTLGTTSQAVALAYITASRGAILIQATSIFTPLLVTAAGQPPSSTVWAGSLLALAGALLVTLEGVGGQDGDSMDGAAVLGDLHSLGGDALTIFAALCYSCATVRIGSYARQVPPLRLALGKSATLAVISAVLLAGEMANLAFHGQQHPLAQLWPNCTDPRAWGIIVYSAAGPGALAAYLHVKGQSLISPTEAQILFSTVPLWSLVFAAALLDGEGGGLYTWLGGGAMVAAGVVSAL